MPSLALMAPMLFNVAELILTADIMLLWACTIRELIADERLLNAI
jgi:hypothetical protein